MLHRSKMQVPQALAKSVVLPPQHCGNHRKNYYRPYNDAVLFLHLPQSTPERENCNTCPRFQSTMSAMGILGHLAPKPS
jgi:hypothetical protein